MLSSENMVQMDPIDRALQKLNKHLEVDTSDQSLDVSSMMFEVMVNTRTIGVLWMEIDVCIMIVKCLSLIVVVLACLLFCEGCFVGFLR